MCLLKGFKIVKKQILSSEPRFFWCRFAWFVSFLSLHPPLKKRLTQMLPHSSCLRSWLEQDTSCPTCRMTLSERTDNQNPSTGTANATADNNANMVDAAAAANQGTTNHFFHFDGMGQSWCGLRAWERVICECPCCPADGWSEWGCETDPRKDRQWIVYTSLHGWIKWSFLSYTGK